MYKSQYTDTDKYTNKDKCHYFYIIFNYLYVKIVSYTNLQKIMANFCSSLQLHRMF